MGQGGGIPQGGPSAMSLDAETANASTEKVKATTENEEDDLPF
jgi:hypothetical protein